MINGAAALAEMVRTATGTGAPDMDRMLPVAAELSGLLPGRGLRRGSTVAVAGAQTFTSGQTFVNGRTVTGEQTFADPQAGTAEQTVARGQAGTAAQTITGGQVVTGARMFAGGQTGSGGRVPEGDRASADPREFAGGGAAAGGRASEVGRSAAGGRLSGVGPAPVGGRAFAGGRDGRGFAERQSPAVGGPAYTAERGMSAGGGTSLMLALLAAASRSGSWCAVVGVPSLGALAAAESGIVLERLALVPDPGPDWPTVVAALIDGVDVVVAAVPGPVPASIVSRLAARARQRGSVLVPLGDWAGADVTLQVGKGRWDGLGSGTGRLRRREVTVVARGRGAAARPREITMWMPGVTVRPFAIPPAPPRSDDPTPRRSAHAAGEPSGREVARADRVVEDGVVLADRVVWEDGVARGHRAVGESGGVARALEGREGA